MAAATDQYGRLQTLAKAYIVTPYQNGTIYLNILPEITDSKGANYTNDPIGGRSTPLINYSYSEPRTIGTDLTFITQTCDDILTNLRYLRILKSLVYPGPPSGSAPFTPPPVCRIVCGKLLGTEDDDGVCVVMRNYSYKTDSSVAWDVETYLPYKLVISCQWEAVYACLNIPTYTTIRTLSGQSWPCPPRNIDCGTASGVCA